MYPVIRLSEVKIINGSDFLTLITTLRKKKKDAKPSRKKSFAGAPLLNCTLPLAPLVTRNLPLIAASISESKTKTKINGSLESLSP
jgi:hypothetical protein